MKFSKLLPLVMAFITISFSISYGQTWQPAGGGSKKASVSELIGLTNVTVEYYRPAVNGREGKIWGNIVHYGFADLGFGTTKAAPWRAGANDNTTIEFTTPVFIEGKPLPAGKYGFFIAMSETKATLIFSKYNTAWGSFYYDPKDDALRVDVPVIKTAESVERLKYEFSDQTDDSAVLSLLWEKVKIPFKVSIDAKKEQIEVFRKAFNSAKFYVYWQNMHAAANYCLVNNINLEEGMGWSERSINDFFGEANFSTLSTYAGFLEKFNRKKEADSVMQKAFPLGTALQIYSYARSLTKMKENQKAYEVFKIGYDKYPNDPNIILGMARGNAAIGNINEALNFCEKALTLFADPSSTGIIKKMMEDLKAGKDINK
ncbi:MAG TPA: DUF2911 domain-containing protein [bacterium]|nr:DUF2911 domain-containing protein [bacterium]HMZ03543.1 DUF2911 domain-containing protein [bacterium]HNB09856.1 DUF2911 domain-containing protein [bacterium]HNB55967.1 DUF2911 domain-containing protein [bacterium]HNC49325.1 DUF2911 domain-containing protein [bacterium]